MKAFKKRNGSFFLKDLDTFLYLVQNQQDENKQPNIDDENNLEWSLAHAERCADLEEMDVVIYIHSYIKTC